MFRLKAHFRFTVFLSLFFSFISAQLKSQNGDQELIKKYNELAKDYIGVNNDSAKYFNRLSLTLSEKNKSYNIDGLITKANILIKERDFKQSLSITENVLALAQTNNNGKDLGKAYHLFAVYYDSQKDFNNALKNGLLALDNREKLKDTSQLISSLTMLGTLYKKNNRVTEGLTYFLRASKLCEQSKDLTKLFSIYINLGTLYEQSSDNKKALEIFYKALKMNKKDNDPHGYAICYVKLGTSWAEEGNLDSAYYYINKTVELHRKQNDEAGLVSSLNKLANILSTKKQYDDALRYFEEACVISERKKDTTYLCVNLMGKSVVFMEQKRFKEAIQILTRIASIFDQEHNIGFKSSIYKKLADSYEATNDFKNAYKYHVLYKTALDSLSARNDVKKQTELKLSYEFDQVQEKQKIEAREKEIENQLKHDSEKKQRYFLLAVLFLALIIIVIAIRSYITKRKSNFLLEKQNLQLDHQKKLVEVKNKEINDSINYAKHIQTACLPDKAQLDSCFPDYYLFFKPKDVVSGDFFWSAQTDTTNFIAIADCTGHGVPGAIMSMIGSMLLNEIFYVKQIHSPEKILSELNRLIKITLKQEGASNSKDGMDIAFCTWNKQKNEVNFSGANRPLYLIAADGSFKEYKPSKIPIGGTTLLNEEYLLHTISVNKGDRVIFSTDGFADQFGGNLEKKINTKKFKEKLVSIATLTSEEQRKELGIFFQSWKGIQEQTDDVLIFSFKI